MFLNMLLTNHSAAVAHRETSAHRYNLRCALLTSFLCLPLMPGLPCGLLKPQLYQPTYC